MNVINYTALKKIEDTVSTSKKPPKKAANPVPEASNSTDIRTFFVNSRSVKSVRGGKKISCRHFRKRQKKAVQKLNFAWIKFRGWPHFSVFRVDLISRFLIKPRNFIHAKFNPRKVSPKYTADFIKSFFFVSQITIPQFPYNN